MSVCVWVYVNVCCPHAESSGSPVFFVHFIRCYNENMRFRNRIDTHIHIYVKICVYEMEVLGNFHLLNP